MEKKKKKYLTSLNPSCPCNLLCQGMKSTRNSSCYTDYQKEATSFLLSSPEHHQTCYYNIVMTIGHSVREATPWQNLSSVSEGRERNGTPLHRSCLRNQRSQLGYSPWGRKRVRHNWATKQQLQREVGRRML